MLGRLVSRKEAQLKVKRGLRVCALLGRDRALASFSPVTVLSLAFEILSNHVHGIHLMMHRWGGAWSAWLSHRKTGRLALGIQGLPPWGLGR